MTHKLEALREASNPDDMLDLFWAIRESATAQGWNKALRLSMKAATVRKTTTSTSSARTTMTTTVMTARATTMAAGSTSSC